MVSEIWCRTISLKWAQSSKVPESELFPIWICLIHKGRCPHFVLDNENAIQPSKWTYFATPKGWHEFSRIPKVTSSPLQVRQVVNELVSSNWAEGENHEFLAIVGRRRNMWNMIDRYVISMLLYHGQSQNGTCSFSHAKIKMDHISLAELNT